MEMEINELLGRLEELSSALTRTVDAAAGVESDGDTVAGLLVQRGQAIEELTRAIAARGPLTYIEFNRMAVIHYQGNQAAIGLKQIRDEMDAALASTTRKQAFANRIAGTLDSHQPLHDVTA
jgi:hypothetical protein